MPLNVKIMCRLCMSYKGVLLFHIFDDKAEKIEKYPDTLPVRISKCLALEINFNDPLPNYICQRCLYNINRFYRFKQKALESCFRINKIIEALNPKKSARNEETMQDKFYQERPIIILNCNARAQEEVDPLALPLEYDVSDVTSRPLKRAGDNLLPNLVPVRLKREKLEFASTAVDSSSILAGKSVLRMKRTYAPSALRSLQSVNIDSLPSTSKQLLNIEDTMLGPSHANASFMHSSEHPQDLKPSKETAAQPEENVHNIDTRVKVETNIQGINKCTVSADAGGSGIVIQLLEPVNKTLLKREQQRFKCPMCSKYYTSKESFCQHSKLHSTPLQCDLCDRNFLNKSALMKHKNLKHAISEIKLFDCKHCEKGFADDNSLLKHTNKCHPIIENLQKSARSKYNAFKCMKCSEVFSDTMSLDEHVRSHREARLNLIHCNLCPLQFKDAVALKKHKSVLHNLTRFACELCSKHFFNKDFLYNHFKTVHIDSLFICEVCSEYFINKSDFETHELQHAKQLRISCKFCSRTFLAQNEVNYHLKTCHAVKIIQCLNCPKIFTEESEYKKHESDHISCTEEASAHFQCESCGNMFLGTYELAKHKSTCSKLQ